MCTGRSIGNIRMPSWFADQLNLLTIATPSIQRNIYGPIPPIAPAPHPLVWSVIVAHEQHMSSSSSSDDNKRDANGVVNGSCL